MKMRTLVAPSLAAALVFSGAGCGEDDDANVNGSGGGGNGEYDVADRETWYGCDIFDDLEPMIEFLDIEETESGTDDGEPLLNETVGEGVNGQSATCSGSAIFQSFEDPDNERYDEREITGGINTWVSPMDDIEESQEWYNYGVDEILVEYDYDENTEGDRSPIEGDWDEGEYFYYVGGITEAHELIFRDANLIFAMKIYHDVEPDDFEVIDFTPDEVKDWLLNTYAPYVHNAVIDHINEEN